MAEVRMSIGGRSYRLACRDGEEPALRAAGTLLESRLAPLQKTHGVASEPRLLLMAALTLAGELLEQRRNPDPPAAEVAGIDADALEHLARRAELLAKKLEEASASS